MEIPPGQKKFECEHCHAPIFVPIDLPATSAPCPICQAITTSPALEAAPIQAEPQAVERVEVAPIKDDRPSEYEGDVDSDRKKGGSGLLWGLAGLTFLALLLGGLFLFKKFRVQDPEPVTPVVASDQKDIELADLVVSSGVEKEALTILEKFFSATTVEEKAQYVIGKEKTISDMRVIYQGDTIEKDDLKADFFSEWEMDSVDTERGIYLLEFELPKQFRLGQLFGPIADLETRLSLEAPDMQTRSKSLRENFEMEAVRAMVFLKKIDDELLIDWHTYVQTKNRMFRNFVNYPVSGRKGTFRVIIMEDVSTVYGDDTSTRKYRFEDPAHKNEDSAVIEVERDSDMGKILEELAWTDIPGKAAGAKPRKGATVVLEWSKDPSPVLSLTEILCWEFLGVGGDPSNLSSSN